ncbi:MAG TPA: hypothetical protein VGS57_00070 [Thermoanaerobaculia bacterium]|jgi:hypothetical protein|nr:hypothetical protein [Thermoanaerobaculia bacterium]
MNSHLSVRTSNGIRVTASTPIVNGARRSSDWRRAHLLALTAILTAIASAGVAVAQNNPSFPDTVEAPYRRHLNLMLSLGYGLSYNRGMLAAGWPVEVPADVEALGMKTSTNLFDMRLSGAYALRENVDLIFALPLGIVQLTAPPGRLPGLVADDFKLAVGEPAVGLASELLREAVRRPAVTVSAIVDMANAEYTSLGDGRYNVTTSASLGKTVRRRILLSGSGGLTRNLARGPAAASMTSFAGTGIGFLSPRGRFRMEAEVTALRSSAVGSSHGSTTADERGRNSYALTLGLEEAGSRKSAQVYFYAPDGQVGFKSDTLGMTLSFPLWPRQPVVAPRPD